jgi:shikimate dehydrogenase
LLDSVSKEGGGSVNTVVNCGGKLRGGNTDVMGFDEALSLYGIPIAGKTFCLYGAGGAARAAASVIAYGGGKLTIAARDTMKAEAVAADITESLRLFEQAKRWPFCGKRAKAEIEAALPKINVVSADSAGQYDTVVNATPVGMSSHSPDGCAVPDNVIALCENVFDMVYNPRETVLIKKAKAHGKNARNGMAMLVFQAVYAQILWKTGELLPMEDVFDPDRVREIIQDMENAV